MRRTATIAALLLSSALIPAWAEGQLEPPPLDRYLRWGPLRVRPGLSLSNIGYDDNIFYSSSNIESDYTATLSPKIDGLVLFGDRAFLTFSERLDYTLYVRNGDQNFTDHRGSARLTWPLGNFGMFTEVESNNFKERPLDLLDIRRERRENLVGIGAIIQPGWRTEIEVSRSLADISYVDPDEDELEIPISERLSRSEETTTLALSYRIFGRTHLLLKGLFQTYDFDSPIAIDDREVYKDTSERRATLGFRFLEGGPLTGTIEMGWSRFNAKDPALPDLKEIVGEMELAYILDSRTKILLEGERRPGFAVYLVDSYSYYLSTDYRLRIVRYLNRLFGIELGGSLGRLTFPESTGDSDRVDRIRRYDGGIRLRIYENTIGRRIEYSFRIGRYNRKSSIPGYEISRTTFNAGVVVGF